MILFLSIIAETILYNYKGYGEELTLTAGQYTIHCYGAQGGRSYKDGSLSGYGGHGAHASGTLDITGNGTKFFVYVGGAGKSDKIGPALGGFNGGGNSGKDTGIWISGQNDDGSGGGGGSTDIRINVDDIDHRIIVAAGGSGGVYDHNGADGGDAKGRYKYFGNYKVSDKTTQEKGNALLQGGNGGSHDWLPGSGGGGGYYGGVGKNGQTLFNPFDGVGDSGSSYVSGHKDCPKISNNIIFTNPEMIVGGNTQQENGYVELVINYKCSVNCYSCKADKTCDVCLKDYYWYNNGCYLPCPDGTMPDESTQKCIDCDSNCKTCSSSITHCDSCHEGFSLYQNECLSTCPNGTVSINQICETCDQSCKTCSSLTTHCETCQDGLNFYENQCLQECPDGTVSINHVCEPCDSPCKKCSSSKSHCESCIDSFSLYENECIEKCPDGFVSVNQVCEKCQSPCKTCSKDVSNCESCEESFYLYNNKCYSDCSELNNQENNDYFGKNNEEAVCQKCAVDNCISCSSDFMICNKCSDLFYLNETTNKCIPKPTQGFTSSAFFTPSNAFTSSSIFTPSSTLESSSDVQTTESSDSQTTESSDSQTTESSDIQTIESSDSQTTESSDSQTTESSDSQTKESSDSQTTESSDIQTSEPLPVEPSRDDTEDDDNCQRNHRCHKEGNKEFPSFMNITSSDFINISYDGNGGAIQFINSGIVCNKTYFINCSSNVGAGGCIFIYLDMEYQEPVEISDCTFIKCKALYGGGIYAFSNLEKNSVSILSCSFQFNTNLYQSILSKNYKNGLYGGSAVFITAKNATISRCSFFKNTGKGALKIYNNFDVVPDKYAKMLNDKVLSVSIFQCNFEIDSELSSSSIFYHGGENEEVPTNIINCRFSGNISKGSHHIDGFSVSKENKNPKLLIQSCKFSNGRNSALNSKHLYASFDIHQQEFENDVVLENKGSVQKYFIPFASILVFALAIAVFVYYYKKNKYIQENDILFDALDINAED